MNAPNTFATYDRNQWFNFSITFANGYALSTLLPVSQLEENKIEIAILCNDKLIRLNDDEDRAKITRHIAFVDPTQLALVIGILSGLPQAAASDTSGKFDMVTEDSLWAIRSILSPTTPVNFQASLHTLSNKKA